ncbi:serine hydrolase domain-containing protein [Arthrobacter sp. Cr_A7]|uniref:serine hydrolase domain-containing protein n=1 Tax=Arthrobacter sp. Cr_A7 TaxID=3031017 RepID=UPI0023DC0762|nr:serine hydrolase domain-containing protein [Arthrobacter sp. Cr_A7]MDF2048448.1 serine hydrolase [Arthrobacter sp. Cr_A7]
MAWPVEARTTAVRAVVVRVALAVVIALGLGAAALAGSKDPPAATAQIGADRFQAADQYLQEQMEQLGLPGVQLAVVEGDRLVHLSAFGVADASGRAMTPQTPVLLASTCKALTAVAVMQQVDAGRLDLDTPVKHYLPWFRTADESKSAKITVAHLLNHTAGFSERDGRAYQAADDRSPQALEQGVRDLSDAVLVAEPGSTFTYSNLNYDILGLLVQTVSGESFDQYMKLYVFAPLQMADSHVSADYAAANGAAHGYYQWFSSVWRPADMPVPAMGAPSSTMYSSAEDLSRLLIAELSGGQYAGRAIVSPESAAALLKPTVTVDGFSSYAMAWFARPLWESLDPAAPKEQWYGLPLVLEHPGSWSNTQSFLAMVPGERLGVVLLVNGASQSTASLARAMDSNVLRILHGKAPVPAEIREEPLQQYGWAVALLALLAELVSLVVLGRVLYRWARNGRPVSGRRLAAVGVLPLLLDAAILWLGLVYIPSHFDADLPVIVRTVPDAGLFIVPALVLTAAWAAVRTALAAWLWFRLRAAAPGPSPTGPLPHPTSDLP